VKRQAKIIRSSDDGKRHIAIDGVNYQKIIDFIFKDERHENKFIDVCNVILTGLRNPRLYDKENINTRCKNVTAMKFFKGQENARIYCQEVKLQGKIFVVVVAELLERKKNKKINRRK